MEIISFFSFKGGVGRTALLSNLAALWSALGKTVLIVDLDLSAPGISYSSLAGPWIDDQGKDLGFSDVLDIYYERLNAAAQTFSFLPPSRLIREMYSPVGDRWSGQGRMYLIPAGSPRFTRPGGVEEGLLRAIPPVEGHPDETQAQTALRALARAIRADLEAWRSPLGKSLDYVLVDSRTGFPELIDLSLGYLADRLVLVAGVNPQNLKGLEITLDALKEDGRISFGDFPRRLGIVLSPIPAGEDAATLAAFEAAHKTIADAMRTNEQGDREPLPHVYYVHYANSLVVTEELVALTRPRSLYSREVRVIAGWLDHRRPQKADLDAAIDENARDVRELLGFPGLDDGAPTEERSTTVPAGRDPRYTATLRVFPLQRLPPWHWPLAPDKWSAADREARLEELMPPNLFAQFDREAFATTLARSVSLSLAEKQRVVSAVPTLSQFQIDQLLGVFTDEHSEFSELAEFEWPDIRGHLEQSALDWAQIVLPDRREAMARYLYAPLSGTALFPSLETWPEYWLSLARQLLNDFDDMDAAQLAIHRAVGLEGPQRVAWQLPALAAALPVAAKRKQQIQEIARSLAPNDPWLAFEEVKAAGDIDAEKARPIVQPLLETPPDDPHRCLDLLEYLSEQLPDLASQINGVLRQLERFDAVTARQWDDLGDLLQDHLGRYDEAEAAYRKAIDLDPKDAYPWNGLGNLLKNHLNRFEEAEAAYHKAIDLDPKFAAPWNGLGNLLQDHLNRYEEAEAAYRKAIDLDPKYAYPWNGLGNLLQDHLNRYEEAEAAYRKAIDLDPKFAAPWNGLGNLLNDKLDRFEEAEAAYRKAIDLDPKFAYPWNGLGNLLQDHLNRYEEAEAAYRKAIDLDPKSATPWNGLGNVLTQHLARYEEAEAAYRKAIDLDPKFAPPWNNLGLLFKDRFGRAREALAVFERGLELELEPPRYPLMSRAFLLGRLGRWEEARPSLRQALDGFLSDKSNQGTRKAFWLSVVLADQAHAEKLRETVKQQANSDPVGYYSVYFLFFHSVAELAPDDALFDAAVDRIRSFNDQYDAISCLYDLAGWRPACREAARTAARRLHELPPEVTARFKDAPKPDDVMLPLLPFLNGESDGAGDPRDLPLWTRGDAPDSDDPSGESRDGGV